MTGAVKVAQGMEFPAKHNSMYGFHLALVHSYDHYKKSGRIVGNPNLCSLLFGISDSCLGLARDRFGNLKVLH